VLTAAVGIGLFLPPIGVGLLMALRFANITVGQHIRVYWPYLAALVVGLMILILFPRDHPLPAAPSRHGAIGGKVHAQE
jgi:C4-dicarboxylate transporter DctM subunit